MDKITRIVKVDKEKSLARFKAIQRGDAVIPERYERTPIEPVRPEELIGDTIGSLYSKGLYFERLKKQAEKQNT
jgi:hypothetical protein